MNTTKRATCPACRRRGKFQAAGEQHWPTAVAKAHGVPLVITLWTCPHCETTISELDLLPYLDLGLSRTTSPG